MPSPTSLLRAKSLSKSVLRSAMDAEATIAANKEFTAQAAKQEREKLSATAQVRIQEHLRVVRNDEDRITGSDDALKQASSVLRNLQHARYAHFAATQVCERRLELRSKRPPLNARGVSQAPRDTAQEALEAQQQVLAGARQSLLNLEEKAKFLLKELEGVRGHLSKDAALRRIAVEQDRAWIIGLSSVPTSSTAQSGAPPAPLQPAGINPQASEAFSRHVLDLEVAVKNLKSEAAAEVLRLKDVCARATAYVEDQLMRSVYELDTVGKRLKEQAKEVDHTVKHAERSMHETKKNLQRSDHVGAEKVKALEGLVGDLRQSRTELQTDIKLKADLLSVDERCRKVTAAMASEKRSSSLPSLASGGAAAASAALGSTASRLRMGRGGLSDKEVAAARLASTASGSWLGGRVVGAGGR